MSVTTTTTSTTTTRPRSRLGKKEKQLLRDGTTTSATSTPSLPPQKQLEWFPLLARGEGTTTTVTPPVVFSPNSSYSFISSGSSVEIYSTSTAQLLSTLSPLAFNSPSSPTLTHPSSRNVSALLLNPSNSLQLIVAYHDGTIRLWDYTLGTLLRTLDLAAPVLFATGHPSLPDQLFVALQSTSTTTECGIYSISLRPSTTTPGPKTPSHPRPPARRMRLAHPRPVSALLLSPTGDHLIALNPHQINICSTAHLQRGFDVQLAGVDEVAMQVVAFHPAEDYFATGDAKGRIRFWYGALNKSKNNSTTPSNGDEGMPMPTPPSTLSTSIFHWHSSFVSSLCFTPNGAYLLSGGSEAVMVLWQLHTGHQEFVPRLGAPIVALSVTPSGGGGESEQHQQQMVAVRLRDGTVCMVGSQKLKVERRIAGLKADPATATPRHDRSSPLSPSQPHRIPLALLPSSSSFQSQSPTLVLPSSHPSSLQFYSPALDAQLLELEISPSNRVSSSSEPTRVELVAFSAPVRQAGHKGGGGYWMATVDSWKCGGYTGVQRLKFWHRKAHQGSGSGSGAESTPFTLTTRIDAPHSAAITSLSFSPSHSSSALLLLTTSLDGRIKLWSLSSSSSSASSSSSWECHSSLSYRSFLPLSATFSSDGSMFAVAHSRSVTLWSTASLSLIHAFPSGSVAPVKKVEFTGEEGTGLMAGGEHGVVGWDLLTFEETYNMSFEVGSLAAKPSSSTVIATEKAPFKPSSSSSAALSSSSSASKAKAFSSASSSTDNPESSTAFIIHAPVASTSSSSLSTAAKCTPRQLPFAVAQSLWLPSPSPSSNDPNSEEEESLSLAVVSASTGEVSLLGTAARVGSAVLPTRLPSALEGKGKSSRLFDEIFGTSEEATRVRSSSALASKNDSAGVDKGKSKLGEGLEVLEMPAHSLPPVRMLWRSMLGGFKVARAQPEAEGVETTDREKIDVEEADQGDGRKVEQQQKDESDTVFAPSQQEELANIFKERLVMSSPKKSPGKQLAGTPKSASKGGKK